MPIDPESSASETIGRRLRRLRTERGFSQRELAAPGVSYAYISRIEAGTRQPSVKALRKLARKLGVSPEYLETGSEIRAEDARELRLADAELQLRLSDDPAAAQQALEAVLAEATEAGDMTATVRARVGLGLASFHQGRHEAAVEQLEGAVESGLVGPATHPDVYATLGRGYVSLGKPARAVDLFERCLALLDEQPDANLAVRTRFATYLSYALSDVGDLDRAEEVVTQAVADAEELADPFTRVRLYWSLARLAVMQGRSNDALNCARRAVALLEATEDTLDLARAHLLCAAILNSNGGASRAERHLELAERLLGPSPDVGDLASLRNEQAKTAAQLGRGEEAVARARDALGLLTDEDPAERGVALWALGEGLTILQDIDGADEAFRGAVDLLAEQGRWRDAAHACRSWGRLLRSSGREAEALDVLDRAAELAGRIASVSTRSAR